ncbi:MAG: QcrA and Rieske domain-containing protein [Myxococcales bacterium]
MSEASASKQTRRSMFDLVLGAGLLGWIGSILFPVLRYLKPLAQQGQNGPIKLGPEDQAKLEKDHSVIVRAGPSRILVFEDAGQQLRAISAKCTHEGCTVQYVPGESVIWCACHNGRFDLDGRVLAGPPPRPLERHTCQREADGAVVIQLGRGGGEAA